MTDKGFKKRGGVGVDILSFKFKRKTNPPPQICEKKLKFTRKNFRFARIKNLKPRDKN